MTNIFKNKCLLVLLTLVYFLVHTQKVFSQIDNKSVMELEVIIDSIINVNMASQQIPGAAYILVDQEKTLLKKGIGVVTLEDKNKNVDPDSTIFRIGSITKTFTAAALLHIAEKNKIGLHEDVNKYLKTVKVPDTFQEPITIHHLLTHSAGFDEIGGRGVFNEEALKSLGEFLKNRLVRIREPGIVSSYSSYAIALAGLLVEDISQVDLETYLRENIWSPLNMKMTNMIIPKDLKAYVSPGYEFYNDKNNFQPWEWYHTYPASEINSTAADMGKYMRMLLNLGKLNQKRVLSEEITKTMLQQQLSSHKEIDGFAYGFYKRTRYNVESIGHGGNMLGYSSFLTLIPEKNIGFYIVNHHEGSNLRNKVNDALLKYFSKNKIIPKQNSTKSSLKKFEGDYIWMTYCHTCSDTSIPSRNRITLNEDNTLSGFGRKFYLIKPLLFKSFDGERTMGFIEDENGEIKYMSLGNINTFEKVK